MRGAWPLSDDPWPWPWQGADLDPRNDEVDVADCRRLAVAVLMEIRRLVLAVRDRTIASDIAAGCYDWALEVAGLEPSYRARLLGPGPPVPLNARTLDIPRAHQLPPPLVDPLTVLRAVSRHGGIAPAAVSLGHSVKQLKRALDMEGLIDGRLTDRRNLADFLKAVRRRRRSASRTSRR